MINTENTPINKTKLKRRRPRRKKSTALTVVSRIFLCFITVIFLVVLFLYSVCAVVFKGPSPAARDKLVASTLEMSAAKWVPKLFFSEDEIEAIIKANTIIESDDITDPDLIVIAPPSQDVTDTPNDEWADHPDGIRIIDIKADTYRGYLMIVRDPSKVYVATSSNFKSGQPGLKIFDAIKKEGAIAAINGGGFPDLGGSGAGDVPLGLTISKGELLWGSKDTFYNGVIGFNNNNVLIVGNMTGKQALDNGIRDCVCFGPILVVNGEAAQVAGAAGSLNPRTARSANAPTVLFFCFVLTEECREVSVHRMPI